MWGVQELKELIASYQTLREGSQALQPPAKLHTPERHPDH